MEKFSQFRDRGSGISPFMPVTTPSSLPGTLFHAFLFLLRLPFFLSYATIYFLVLHHLPFLPGVARKLLLWCLLAIPGIWWVDLQLDGVKRGSLSQQPRSRVPHPRSLIAANFTSPIDALYLAAVFDPIFVAAHPASRKVRRISLLAAILTALSPRAQLAPLSEWESRGGPLTDLRAHKDKKGVAEPDRYACDAMREVGDMMPGLFNKTDNLFDPFASPSLFFRTAGLDIPPSFTRSSTLASQIDHLASASEEDDLTAPNTTPPRRAALVFPPRASTLKIPETHLLYTRARRKGRAKARGNTFETQALGLAEVMRRSVEREVRERMVWDDEVGEGVPDLRVRTHDLGLGDGAGMGAAEGALRGWLEEKFGF